jgi:MOSC domain-containing protein YiiM
MHLLSVNIGARRRIEKASKSGWTGIFKESVSEPVAVTADGLPGDAVCDKKNHGGPDQAVYVYGADDYAWWSAELGQDLVPGTFGENLTIAGLESARYSIGDRLHIGTAVLEVTAPRIPCSTLAARMGDPGFVKRYRAAERPGLYCRVIQPGTLQAGDAVAVEPHAGPTVTVPEMFREFFEPDDSVASLRRYLAAPIAIRARADKEARLRKVLNEEAT